ncbi:hypothetical protein C8J57DRAFT_1406430 [Mycena rebaudengoi]|nr:hypothetical protein C8J57DRAFT_1406430 [Mycena rebaudengoi]
MHCALQTIDIVALLCSELAGDIQQNGGSSPERQNIAAFARTCKIFLDPAHDLLWSNQRNTMMNILMCMPSDLWISPTATDVKYLEISRRITATDWARPLIYMRRVKTFAYSTQTMPSPRLLEALCLSFPEEHLFPNLRKFYWQTPKSPHAPYVPLFLSPTITRTIFAFSESDHDLSLLWNLASECPNITDASIYCLAVPSVSQFVLRLTAIESLEIQDLDQSAFEYLARLRTLTSLELRRPGSFNPACEICKGDVFVSLRRLNFGTIAPEAVARFLRPFRDSPLISLTKNCPRTTLRDLRVRSTDLVVSRTRHTEPQIIRDAMMRPLLGLSALTSLYLSSRDGFDLDDTTFADMAASWPHIERLELMTLSEYEGFTPRATLRSLYSFARHCPRLERLQILFDATSVPLASEDADLVHGALRSLALGRSPISAPIVGDVAAFLCSLFPNLGALATGHHEWESDRHMDEEFLDDRVRYHRRWKEVERLLPAHVVEEDDDDSDDEEEDEED